MGARGGGPDASLAPAMLMRADFASVVDGDDLVVVVVVLRVRSAFCGVLEWWRRWGPLWLLKIGILEAKKLLI
jgi:hypothetical protein